MPIRHEPVALMLSRQPLPTLDRARYASAVGVARGAYVLADPPSGEPEVILIATGSEVMTVEAYEQLTADGIRARMVSMPSMELFDKQPRSYHDEVLPPSVTARVSVEKGSTFGWDRWVGPTGAIIGMSTFRRVGAAEGAAGQVRLHRRKHRGRRTDPARPRAQHRRARRHP